MDDLANGQFQEVLDDPNVTDKKAIKTLVSVQVNSIMILLQNVLN